MSEIILFLVIISLIVFLFLQNKENHREKRKLIHALFAKTIQDMQNMEFADKVDIIKVIDKTKDIVEPKDMTQEEFEKFIEKEVLV